MSKKWTWQEVSPLALAFMGDAVWEVYVRNYVLAQGVRRPDLLHRHSSRYVRATAQAQIVEALYNELSEAEQQMIRRGRNAKPSHTRKNSDVLQYRHSTGFEALIGFLYSSGQEERLDEICGQAVAVIDGREDDLQ